MIRSSHSTHQSSLASSKLTNLDRSYFFGQSCLRLNGLFPIKPLSIVSSWGIMATHNSLMIMMMVDWRAHISQILYHFSIGQTFNLSFKIWLCFFISRAHWCYISSTKITDVDQGVIHGIEVIISFSLLQSMSWALSRHLHVCSCLIKSLSKTIYMSGRDRVITGTIHCYHMVLRLNTIRSWLMLIVFISTEFRWTS